MARISLLSSRTVCLRQYAIAHRGFCSSVSALSHIGSAPVFIPDTVQLMLDVHNRDDERDMTPLIVSGPKGTLQVQVPSYARLDLVDNGKKLEVKVADAEVKIQRQMWGTLRSLINNQVTGVSEGHIVILQFVGTGYRAELLPGGRQVSVKVGQTGTTVFDIPEGITALSPQPTRLVLEGIDKQAVKQFAANIRALRPPEPYKGKGIFVNNETIKMKDKKVK
ncbi:ribosomal protein L6, alpha-beta domain-containing protein [Lipomyces orientalis]|uniref:Ribosomal protein L6, alpha-beta domain-containing protein n=1 Tax=Lipomyces orientalis TaxID=1233043 RepID=A0ACC3TNN7_9ASCO